MQEKTVTVLPQAPVRYGYNCPSMSRRGGTRLHPVRDGVINMQAGQQYIRTRDYMGQKLRDYSNPRTGMYSHSTSVAESDPLNGARSTTFVSGVNGNPTGQLKLLASSVVDSAAGRVYLDDEGRVIRTTAMGEAPVIARPPKSGTVNAPRSPKGARSVKPRAPKRPVPSVPGGTGEHGRITDEDVRAYVKAVAGLRGVELTVVTAAQMQAGREALKIARKQAAAAIASRTRDMQALAQASAAIKRG